MVARICSSLDLVNVRTHFVQLDHVMDRKVLLILLRKGWLLFGIQLLVVVSFIEIIVMIEIFNFVILLVFLLLLVFILIV
jgi:hypothetical protein